MESQNHVYKWKTPPKIWIEDRNLKYSEEKAEFVK